MNEARAPAVAGRFYPGVASRIRDELRTRMQDAPAPVRVHALVAPHAGWIYSGTIAAQTWASAEIPPSVVVLCPNHTGLGVPGSLWGGGAWSFPGGALEIDTALRDAIADTTELELDTLAHLREHAIEVHVPMLATLRPDARIVPIVLARMDYAACVRLADGLQRAIDSARRSEPGSEVLVVASTDMSHYVPAERAREQDGKAIARIQALDPAGLHAVVERERISMCGYVPTTVALQYAIGRGARSAELVRYGHSGEQSGDFERVVGYAGLRIA